MIMLSFDRPPDLAEIAPEQVTSMQNYLNENPGVTFRDDARWMMNFDDLREKYSRKDADGEFF